MNIQDYYDILVRTEAYKAAVLNPKLVIRLFFETNYHNYHNFIHKFKFLCKLVESICAYYANWFLKTD